MTIASASLPLSGVRVLDFTHAAAGPFATMLLADLGADVIKIEKPGRGDGARFMGEPMLGSAESDYYVSINRNKRGLLLDLRTSAGRDLALELAERCDVVMENFRPSVMDPASCMARSQRSARRDRCRRVLRMTSSCRRCPGSWA